MAAIRISRNLVSNTYLLRDSLKQIVAEEATKFVLNLDKLRPKRMSMILGSELSKSREFFQFEAEKVASDLVAHVELSECYFVQ